MVEAKSITIENGSVHSIKSEKDTVQYYVRDIVDDVFNGDKFAGSFGPTKRYDYIDYWTLRQRSLQLFTENLQAAGLIKSIVRNEIYTGLLPRATPIAAVLWPDKSEDEREKLGAEYAGKMTELFELYAGDYNVFDYRKQKTCGEFQETVRMESIICGDGIIVERINPQTNLPYWDWINGNYIRTPLDYTPSVSTGNKIEYGVELDSKKRHIAYWVEQWDGTEMHFVRIPVFGQKSGRQISWMVYGDDKLLDDVRGQPLLSKALYRFKELDRAEDAECRAADVNAMLPIFIKRSVTAGPGSHPFANMIKSPVTGAVTAAAAENNSAEPAKDMPKVPLNPGTILDSMAPGEEPVSFNTNRPNVNFKVFDELITSSIYAYTEQPPETVRKQYTSSYSASRQANNDLELYLKYRAYKNSKDFMQEIYSEFIIQAVLNHYIVLPGFQGVVFDPAKWMQRDAWLHCEWTGMSRPSVDMNREATATKQLLDLGVMTFDQAARKFAGMSFKAVMYERAKEKRIMDNVGFVPSTDENNNGEPVQPNNGSDADNDDDNEDSKNGNGDNGNGKNENGDNGKSNDDVNGDGR